LVENNTRPNFLNEIGAGVLDPLGDVGSARGYDGFANRFRRLGLLPRNMRKPLLRLLKPCFRNRDRACA
jgi:hypothetical protein